MIGTGSQFHDSDTVTSVSVRTRCVFVKAGLELLSFKKRGTHTHSSETLREEAQRKIAFVGTTSVNSTLNQINNNNREKSQQNYLKAETESGTGREKAAWV